jgi:hypothetical protein
MKAIRCEQIQFPERFVFYYLEFRMMDEVHKPSNDITFRKVVLFILTTVGNLYPNTILCQNF